MRAVFRVIWRLTLRLPERAVVRERADFAMPTIYGTGCDFPGQVVAHLRITLHERERFHCRYGLQGNAGSLHSACRSLRNGELRVGMRIYERNTVIAKLPQFLAFGRPLVCCGR